MAEAAPTLWSVTGGAIASGPFRGMRYLQEAAGSAWAPKLLGTYEIEIAPIIRAILSSPPKLIVDVGAAEGYYAVGLARGMPETLVVAFEADLLGRELLRRLAACNGVSPQLEIRGLCTTESLNEVLKDATDVVIICDVEGAELEILDPERVPELAHARVLVEVHPWAHQDPAGVLRSRFDRTHRIRELISRQRSSTDRPLADDRMSSAVAAACMDEMRPCPMSWLWLTPQLSQSQ